MTKLELIEKALNDHIISLDVDFVRTCRARMNNEKQLDSIIADIGSYRNSATGLMFANCDHMMQKINSWNDWRFITLTFSPGWRKWHNPIIRNATEHAANEAKTYVKRFNQDLSGEYFSRAAIKNNAARLRMIAKIGGDNIATNIHYHCLVEVPSASNTEQFDNHVAACWPHGTIDAQRYNDDLKSCCLYLIGNEKQIGKIGGEMFNVDILHTTRRC